MKKMQSVFAYGLMLCLTVGSAGSSVSAASPVTMRIVQEIGRAHV